MAGPHDDDGDDNKDQKDDKAILFTFDLKKIAG